MRRIMAAFLVTMAALALPAQARTLVMGVVPQQSASRLAQMWMPLLAEISARSGVAVAFATAPDIPAFERCVASGAYDLAYMNPHHYAVLGGQGGYRPFARRANTQLRGIVVVRKDAAFEGPEGLDGARIAFPEPGSFGATLLTQAAFRDRGVSIEPVFVKSHDAVYRAVATGIAPAGGGVIGTLDTAPAEVRDELRILHQTPGFAPHPFTARDDVPDGTITALHTAMRAIAAEAPALTKGAGFDGFDAASDADYAPVRALNIPPAPRRGDDALTPCRFD
jgi:phosphonate transport system substrate-binding protein